MASLSSPKRIHLTKRESVPKRLHRGSSCSGSTSMFFSMTSPLFSPYSQRQDQKRHLLYDRGVFRSCGQRAYYEQGQTPPATNRGAASVESNNKSTQSTSSLLSCYLGLKRSPGEGFTRAQGRTSRSINEQLAQTEEGQYWRIESLHYEQQVPPTVVSIVSRS